MDFHSIARKELQALCKKNKIPANMTNVAMADALQALQNVEGLEEFLNPSDSNLPQSPEKNVNGSPDIPRTTARVSTLRKPTKQETKSTQPVTRTRRGTRGSAAQGIDQENRDVNVLITPALAVPGSRRRVPAASSRRKIETQLREAKEDEKSEAQERSEVVETPVVPSTRRRAPATSALRKLETENSVQRVYSTRHSVRLLEKSLGKMNLVENGKAEPVKIDDLSEEMANSSEISELSVQFEKEMSEANTQTVSEVGSEETNDSEVLSDPKPVESMETESKVDIKDMNKSNDVTEEDNLKSERADNSGVVKVSEVIDEAVDEGSDESDIISSEKLEMAIDVDDDEAVDEKGPDDVPFTEQDTRSEDSLAVKDASAEAMDHVSESLSPQHECQNLASKDSELNVTEGHDHSNCDSESESATEGESDEEIASDENSSECEENYSDDDAETEEDKDLEAPVLPIGFEKLENNHSGSEGILAEQLDTQVSVENQASTMEIYNTEALVEDSLAVKDASAEAMDHVPESVSPQHECQNLPSNDSELNVTEGHDHSNCDSESESTTEGESDSESESATEEIASAENSSECEENYSDDDAETEEEKDLEAPVLPIGFEKLENNHSGSEGILAEQLDTQVSVENHQASTMEIYNLEALVEDSLAVKVASAAEAMDHVPESLSPQHECQNLASKDSEQNVTEGHDHSNCDSESESTTERESDSESESATEGESDEEIASDEEKDLEAPVLPTGSESIVAEQSDIQVSVEDQASTMEIYNSEALIDVYVTEAEEVTMKTNDQSSVETPMFMKNMSPVLISDCEVTLSTVATNKASCHAEDPMAKAEDIKHETLVDVCVMPAHESNIRPDLISDSKVPYEIPSQPFAADQLSGQFPRPTQLTPRESSAIKDSTIQKVTDVSGDDEENIDTSNVEVELDKEKAKPDDELAGKSLRQLTKMLKEMHIKSNKKQNTDKSVTKEHVGKKRIALQALPENCSIAVDEGLKEN